MYPIHRSIVLTIIFLGLFACSNAAPKNKPSMPNNPTSVTVDISKPATFADYKKWREDNDPKGQSYAEFKQWEAAYKEWKRKQRELIK